MEEGGGGGEHGKETLADKPLDFENSLAAFVLPWEVRAESKQLV